MPDLIGHLNGPAEALCTVFQDQEAVMVGDGTDSHVIGRKAEKVHGDNHFRSQPSLGNHFPDSTLQVLGIQIEGVLAYIHEHRGRPFQGNNLGGGEEREIGHKHRIPGADTPRLQGQGQCIRAIGTGKAVLHAHILGQFLFQGLDLRAHDIGP